MEKAPVSRPFVVYWNNIPSPYMVARFNALAQRGNVDFQAWFNDRTAPDRSWDVDESAWAFSYRYLPGFRIVGQRFHWPTPVFGRRPDLLISLYNEPVFMFGWLIARARGSKTGFRVLLTFDRWVRRSPFRNRLKRLMFRRVDCIETTGEDGKAFAVRSGAAPERVHRLNHTVVGIDEYRHAFALREAGATAARQRLGVVGTVYAYVGRLWWGKGVDVLLEAFVDVQQRAANPVSLLIIGDGESELQMRDYCARNGARHVVFAGFRQASELPYLLACADVFVFPTLGDPYGLVIDEAMASGLPIVSTSAAGEIRERVVEGRNGYVVCPDNASALADGMLRLSNDETLRRRMGRESLEIVAGNTPERWAERFEQLVDATLSNAG
jgi:glycosyltransferase involved in cell wall biosynthesis